MKHSQIANMVILGQVASFDGKTITAETFDGETQSDILLGEAWGTSSRPETGSEVLILAVNGSASRRVAIPIRFPEQTAADAGQTVFASPNGQNTIKLTDQGIEIVTATNITVNGRKVSLEGDTDTGGDTDVSSLP